MKTKISANTFSQTDIERVFKIQKAFQRRNNPIPVEDRKRLLLKFRETLLKYKEEVKQALYEDLGRPTNEEISFEIGVTLQDIDEAIENLDEWTRPTIVEPVINKKSKAYLKYEPKGVVLLLGVWNFPISLITTPLVAVISAGNSAIIKPTESTPSSGRILKTIINEAFEEQYVSIFEGDREVTTELQKLSFDHVFFTGSPAIGKVVMAAAAANLSSVTLELGGKNPAILDATADLEQTVEYIVQSRLMNGGQTCLCIDYICVPKDSVSELTKRLVDKVKADYYVDGEYQSNLTSRIINKRNFDRIANYLEDAKKKGAKFEFGGNYKEDKLVIEPTILTNVPANATIMEEEIFGPVFVILPYDDIQEAYDYMNTLGKPLGMFIYSKDDTFVQHILNHTSSGIVCVNGWLDGWMDSSLPFGGVGTSGIGAYHGIYGFKELSHQRAVYENTKDIV